MFPTVHCSSCLCVSVVWWMRLKNRQAVLLPTLFIVPHVCVCQGSDGWDRDPQVPAAWHLGRASACSPPHPHPQVPGQQWNYHVVQNLPVGCHLPPVSNHLSCRFSCQGVGVFRGSMTFSGCEVCILYVQGSLLCGRKRLMEWNFDGADLALSCESLISIIGEVLVFQCSFVRWTLGLLEKFYCSGVISQMNIGIVGTSQMSTRFVSEPVCKGFPENVDII